MKNIPKPLKTALICLIVAVAVFLFVYCVFLAVSAFNTPKDANIIIEYHPETKMTVTWQGGGKAQCYKVSVTGSSGTVFEGICDENCAVFDRPAYGEQIHVTVTACRFFGVGKVGWRAQIRKVADVTLKPEELSQLTQSYEIYNKNSVILTLDSQPEHQYQVCETDSDAKDYRVAAVCSSRVALFRLGRDIIMPDFGQPTVLVTRQIVPGEGYTLCGEYSAPISVKKEEILGTDIILEHTTDDSGNILLSWSTVKGDRYKVEQWIPKAKLWRELDEVSAGEPYQYKLTEELAPGSMRIYRVEAFEGAGGKAITSAETMLTTECSVKNDTAWPQKALDMYKNSDKTEKCGTVAAGKAMLIEDEKDGMFLVKSGTVTGYVDSRYCLINLAQYMNELCAYNITNSYSSIFKVHDYDIPEVTGEVLEGFENVELAPGDYLVPYLYPCAQKLMSAAQEMLRDGYRIKIYEAFRPYSATRSVYDLTAAILDDQLPEDTDALELDALAPEPTKSAKPADGKNTYRFEMTNGTLNLNCFLAQGGSNHNIGIALDMTMEKADSGEELEMQTAMHDLSWHSTTYQNNANAKILAGYMTTAGFKPLSTEWWHFEDDATKSALKLTINFNGGVSPY